MTDPTRQRTRITVDLTEDPLDVAQAVADVAQPECGGIGVFLGAVRDHHEGASVESLDYEAWEEEAVPAMRAVAEGVLERFTGVRAVHVSHRVGHLDIGDVSVIVAASAPHRGEAIAASEALIDDLKRTVPIWKHEHLADGTSRWPELPA